MGTIMRITGMSTKRKHIYGVSVAAFFRPPQEPRPPLPPRLPPPVIPEKIGHYYRVRNIGKEIQEARNLPPEEQGRPPAIEIPMGGFLPLWDLQDNPHKKKKRVGRGIGSGKGKTCGKGHKGQKSRSGHKPRLGFEGGQSPLRLRMPRRNDDNPFKPFFKKVTLRSLKAAIEDGKIDPSKLITMKSLRDSGLYGKRYYDGVILCGRGGVTNFDRPIHVEVSRVSPVAKESIEDAGGTVRKVHYNKLGLKALCDPNWFIKKKKRVLPKPARPKPKVVKHVDDIGRLPAPESPILPEGFQLKAPVHGYPPPPRPPEKE